jgi:hypothetical protein
MAIPLPKEKLRAFGEERRRFQRVRVDLLGRYMLPDRREFPCQVVNMSPGGMALIAPVSGAPGERVIAYVDHLGRLEGHVARIFQNGFAMTIAARQACRPTDLARQPPYPRIAGRPPSRPHGAAQPDHAPDPAERHQYQLPDPRRIAIGRRHYQRSAPADRHAGDARQGARPGRAPSRRRLRDRIHAAAASGFSGRRHRPFVEHSSISLNRNVLWNHLFVACLFRKTGFHPSGRCPRACFSGDML